MDIDIRFMQRCLQLAENGKGYTSPNPMVGAVIVHHGKIIGEGFHRECGKPHAEVNAVNSVKDKSLLKDSTIYVSLEPCSHHGKTPPCAELIIRCGIPRVVVATLDPYPEVAGRGVQMLREAGIEVETGILEKEARLLNRAFFTCHTLDRPYVYLKWAQTKDGFIDKIREEGAVAHPTPISNELTRMVVHKLRAEVSAIMVGTTTATKDNPSLSTRFWYGKNPVRVVIDRTGRIPNDYRLLDGKTKTLVFTEQPKNNAIHLEYINVTFDESLLENILKELKSRKIDSLLVEGGCLLLQSFIDKGLWDEAFVEVAHKEFGSGVCAPVITGNILKEKKIGDSLQKHFIKI